MQFEWDAHKAQANRQNHGVSFEEASTAFRDPFAVILDDPDHSDDEERSILLGVASPSGRLLFISYTERDTTTRLISARAATRAERTIYEDEL